MLKICNLSTVSGSFGIPNSDSDGFVLNRTTVIHAKGNLTVQESKRTNDVYIMDSYIPDTDYSGGMGFDLYHAKADSGEYLFFKDLLGSISHTPSRFEIASLGVTDLGAVFGIDFISDEPSQYLIVVFNGCVYVAQTRLDLEKLYKGGVFVKSIKKCSSIGKRASEKVSSALWLHLSSTTMEEDYVLLVHTKQIRAGDTGAIYLGNAIEVFYSHWPRSRLVDYRIEDGPNYIDDRGQETYSVDIKRSSKIVEDPHFFEIEDTVVVLKIKNRPVPTGPHRSTEWVVPKHSGIFPSQF